MYHFHLLQQEIKARSNWLTDLITEKRDALKNVPAGTLRVSPHRNQTQYYHRTDLKNKSGNYIKKSEHLLVQRLAQKDYDQRVLSCAEKELILINKLLRLYSANAPERIYEYLIKPRQDLVTPVELPDQQFVKEWISVEYEKKGFSPDYPEYYTVNGERVRSKTEVLIADALNRRGIPYRYEYPVFLDGLGSVHPDFTVLNTAKRICFLWEHFGMMDDADYCRRALEKIYFYQKNGYYAGKNMIITFETARYPIQTRQIEAAIREYLL